MSTVSYPVVVEASYALEGEECKIHSLVMGERRDLPVSGKIMVFENLSYACLDHTENQIWAYANIVRGTK